jgi:hypothetical protein
MASEDFGEVLPLALILFNPSSGSPRRFHFVCFLPSNDEISTKVEHSP